MENVSDASTKQTATLSSDIECLEQHIKETQEGLNSMQQNLEERIRRVDNRMGNSQASVNEQFFNLKKKN